MLNKSVQLKTQRVTQPFITPDISGEQTDLDVSVFTGE